MADPLLRRRAFLKTTAAGAAGAALGLPLGARSAKGAPSSAAETLRLGVASYSLRKFPRARAIEMVKALRTPYINIKSFHLEYDLSPAE
ncbi:MAG TPA: twin-arginine translocation signal domain-containing protein, partial [Longimicrobiales bacterium]